MKFILNRFELIFIALLIIPFTLFSNNAQLEKLKKDYIKANMSTAPKIEKKEPNPEKLGLQAQIYYRIKNDISNTKLFMNLGAMNSYKLTPGDIFTLYVKSGNLTEVPGGDVSSYEIQLLQDYTIELPLIGTIQCKNKTFQKLQKEVISKIKSTFSVFYVNFIFTQPAQFNIFVHGKVQNPGRLQITPITTLAQAIGATGGFTPNGSYRQIELKRKNKIIKIDLTRYYTFADESQNPYLQPEDIIFVPQAEKIVKIQGQVPNPGIYEMLPFESIQDLISSAGDLTIQASTETFEIERTIGHNNQRLFFNHFIKEADNITPENGDKVYIRSISENSATLLIDGAIYGKRHLKLTPESAPAIPQRINLPYTEGATILSVLDAVGGPTPYARYKDAFIKRRGSLERENFDLRTLWEKRSPEFDIKLKPGDQVIIPIKILKIFVGGEVRKPGAFDFNNGFSPLDYIMLAGGYQNSADMKRIYTIQKNGKPKKITLDSKLEPGEILYIRKNHAAEAGKAFENITVYTQFISTILGTMNGALYFVRQLQDSNVISK